MTTTTAAHWGCIWSLIMIECILKRILEPWKTQFSLLIFCFWKTLKFPINRSLCLFIDKCKEINASHFHFQQKTNLLSIVSCQLSYHLQRELSNGNAKRNIATGETSWAIASSHFLNYFHCFHFFGYFSFFYCFNGFQFFFLLSFLWLL